MLKDFLNTNRSLEELAAALETVRDFRECESHAESKSVSLESWHMTDVLEDMLAYLVEGQPMAQETMTQLQLF
jgi:hypothetical protein